MSDSAKTVVNKTGLNYILENAQKISSITCVQDKGSRTYTINFSTGTSVKVYALKKQDEVSHAKIISDFNVIETKWFEPNNTLWFEYVNSIDAVLSVEGISAPMTSTKQ